MYNINLFYRYIIVFIKSKMEYRFSFFMDLFAQIFTNSMNCIVIWTLINKFENIGGWNFYELLILYSFNLTSFGIAALFFWGPMYKLEHLIKQGEFDTILFKPINSFILLIITQFDYAFFAHIILGLIFMIISIINLNIILSFGKIILLITLVFSAALVQAALLIICGSINFWYVKSGVLINILVWGIRKFLEYPLIIYNGLIQFILIFIIPYAFASYFPALIILEKDSNYFDNSIISLITPIVGVSLFFIAYKTWCMGVSKYESTGN